MLTSNPPLSLYIHLPWCERKCPYCDFNSHASTDFNQQDYIAALIDDLEQELPSVWGRKLHSLFIGGGTPSLFSATVIDQLLSQLRARLAFLPNCEITLEANPGSAEAQRFQDYRKAGINRLSIGVQSFDDGLLQRLGRIHSAAEAVQAIQMATAAGFENINIDLMFALPGQTLDQAQNDLQQAISLQPQQISRYQLTIEPNTWFAHETPDDLPDDDLSWSMQSRGTQLLVDCDYQQYEVSAFARPGFECRHNLNYWHYGDFLGIGAGAHGKITLAAQNQILRNIKLRSPKDYLKSRGSEKTSSHKSIDSSERVFEFMLNALRLTHGFDEKLFTERTGLELASIQAIIDTACEKGLLTHKNSLIKPTELGQQFLNDLQMLFLDVKVNPTHDNSTSASRKPQITINFDYE